ncbi:response regulator [Nocardia aurea]|uniref:response regulator n=1 Tax=Nocardia aurea TaxID=2144174 RepID=UPI000D697ED6|nr:response regulator transcription factor [Nocardia aurea]
MPREPERTSPALTRTRVLLVDDHVSVRRSIRAYLEMVGIEVVAEAGEGREALHVLDTLSARCGLPDVVLMDLVMPGMDGVVAAGRIARNFPEVRVIVLTGFGRPDQIETAMANGADSFLLKDAAPGEIARAILQPQVSPRSGAPGPPTVGEAAPRHPT